jgi:hypothetical protein
MQAVVFYESELIDKIEIQGRFQFEDQFLKTLVRPRPCEQYRDHHPSPKGVRVSQHPETHEFQAEPYLEFAEHCHGKSRFHVMQEGQPTGFMVVLG